MSQEIQDIYSTEEPKAQFNKRIEFCLEVHNSALRAHKYPPNSHRAKLEADKSKDAEELAELEAMDEDGL